jgi:5-methylcytosine-specific restriction protein A
LKEETCPILHLKVGKTLSNKELSRMFNVSVQRGIRYSGSLNSKIHHVVLIATFQKIFEDLKRNPYEDRKIGNQLLYTGEGRYGDQKMRGGNLVLKQSLEEKYPIYVFEKKSPGRYAFLGRYKVLSVQTGLQKDSRGAERKVFLFKLHKCKQ